jgi:DNA-binding CsgD family transcriptional regulator
MKMMSRSRGTVPVKRPHGSVAVMFAANSMGPFAVSAASYELDRLASPRLVAVPQPFAGGPVDVPASLKEPGMPTAEAPALSATSGMLSIRQREVLNLIVQGLSNKEIARALGLAEGTVKIHIAALFGKLGVHRRSAVALAGARFLAEIASNASNAGRHVSKSARGVRELAQSFARKTSAPGPRSRAGDSSLARARAAVMA